MNPIPAFKKTFGRPRIDVSLDEKAEIGSHVFIGTNAIICKGVTLSDNAIIAAGAVVVKSIPPGEVWGGNPATLLH